MASRHDARPVFGVGMIVLGGLLLLRQIGALWFDDAVVWPVVVAAMGLYVIWRQAAGSRRTGTMLRVVGGVGLVAAGVALFLATHGALTAARNSLLAIAAVLAGLGVMLAPLLWRLVQQLTEERRERIRSEERAEVAAHLHDSVLQTLSLIQRSASDPRTVTALARRQERELRTWLFQPRSSHEAGGLAEALERVGADVEDAFGVPVDTVVVADAEVDEGLAAVVLATREAVTNAARHSGAERVAVFAEVEPERVTVFVRDTGSGFDPKAVAPDRRGLSESVVGRMRRHGGQASVRSAEGEGTEVELTIARASA
jgi:signal transduction histidine kinase